jgi:hypothetical protein
MTQRAEYEILVDIQRVYTALSPENLACDGELASAAIKAKRWGLQQELRDLFVELGRHVNEDEAFLEAPGCE